MILKQIVDGFLSDERSFHTDNFPLSSLLPVEVLDTVSVHIRCMRIVEEFLDDWGH